MLQVNREIFFPKDFAKKSSDYANNGILYIDDAKNFTVDNDVSFAHDKKEAKWDYFREDPLFHVFHTMLHAVII